MSRSKYHRRGVVTFVIVAVVALVILIALPPQSYWLLVGLVPLLFLAFTFMDAASSEEQADRFDNPLIGREVFIERRFTSIQDYFEGAVLLNGASWTARSSRQLQPGDSARVRRLDGHTLLLH